MVNIKRFVVTRDSVEVGSDQSIVVWEEGATPKLNKEGLWDKGDGESYNNLFDDMTVKRFKEAYNLNPPGLGSKKTMVASYEWEEE